MTNKVRLRFAPSPTGPLHIGGVRTALYNYLFARKHNGTFILRIEDTDQTRFVPGAEQYIVESLDWCGITFDEGVSNGGPFAPYRQSERKDIYMQYAQQLLESGYAYIAFDSPEELDALRREYEGQKQTFQYDATVRMKLKNSLTLSASETQELMDNGVPSVIRFLTPENEEVVVNDLIRGTVKVDSSQLDDKVLFKADGLPTYHLANVVDDHLMEITHVIRGEEWLPSAPLHVLLYRGLGWESSMPQFAHLPLLLKPDGQGKLSKRDGDRLGFPVFPLQWRDPSTGEISSGYRESGYFPEAFVNILALLGWNPGTEQELFSMDELISAFSLENVGKSGAKFNPEKARWFNHQHLIRRSDQEIAGFFAPILRQKGIEASEKYLIKICGLVKERVHFVEELWEQSEFFFKPPDHYDASIIKKRWNAETPAILQEISANLMSVDSFHREQLEGSVKNFISQKQLNMGQVMNTLRLCLVGAATGPDLFIIMELFGKDEVISRIRAAVEKIHPEGH